MTKQELRSIIFNHLQKLDKTAKYHNAIIDRDIEKVLGEMYLEAFKRNPLEVQRYARGYGYTVPLTISLEGSTGLYYTTLPVGIVALPDKASGVRRISTPIQSGLTFVPMDQREMDYVMTGGNVNTVTTKIGYVVTPTRVEYYKPTGAVINSGVRMDLLPTFSSLNETDTLLIPDEKDDQGQGVVMRVLALLGVIPPVDLKDDNSDESLKQTK